MRKRKARALKIFLDFEWRRKRILWARSGGSWVKKSKNPPSNEKKSNLGNYFQSKVIHEGVRGGERKKNRENQQEIMNKNYLRIDWDFKIDCRTINLRCEIFVQTAAQSFSIRREESEIHHKSIAIMEQVHPFIFLQVWLHLILVQKHFTATRTGIN